MKPITIIGGGLAGLFLGIRLREHDVPVTLFEAGRYPRHRVCGEFISGVGAQLIRDVLPVEPRPAETVAFFTERGRAGRHRLPASALCISRFVLDAALAKRFRALGGELRERTRWAETAATEGTVFATGRQPSPTEAGWRWFGLKAHALNVSLEADLEMHCSRNSYVGLCRLTDDSVNVCGLFRRPVNVEGSGSSMDWLRGSPGSPLFTRLEAANFVPDSFCAIAGLNLSPQPIEPSRCRIGDALTMIPPITGNGMSMALESADLTVKPLLAYTRGDCSWGSATTSVATALRGAFERRLNWAARLHSLMFSPIGFLALPALMRVTPFWRASFAVTR